MTVYLVGAGPGDPGLLTVRGRQLLERAQVVVYDLSIPSAILALASGGAELVGVDDERLAATDSHDDVAELLVARASEGLEVVRLITGDPLAFAHGAEQALALRTAGIAFEIVPGVNQVSGASAYAGVALTYPGLASGVSVLRMSGRGPAAERVDWAALVATGHTIVVVDGGSCREEIASCLMEAGMAPATPVALVARGTCPDQKSDRTMLAVMSRVATDEDAMVVIGGGAGVDLGWFESRPLFGRRIVVTRAAEQAPDLVDALAELGATPVEVPAIELADPADGGLALAEAAKSVGDYDWVIFTSANAVKRFVPLLRDARAFGTAKVAVIGPATADALSRFAIVADLVPPRFVAESLLESFPARGPGAGRVLLPRAAVARDVLPDGLRDLGWSVDVVEAYRTLTAHPSAATLASARAAHIITFTSSSTVTNYLEVAGAGAVPPFVACIGPIAARTAEEAGLRVDLVADVHTVEGLVSALVDAVGGEPRLA